MCLTVALHAAAPQIFCSIKDGPDGTLLMCGGSASSPTKGPVTPEEPAGNPQMEVLVLGMPWIRSGSVLQDVLSLQGSASFALSREKRFQIHSAVQIPSVVSSSSSAHVLTSTSLCLLLH